MKTILICDDAKFITEIVRKVLTKKGYQVMTLENCDNLMEIVQQNKPDLILMDLMIPPLGGEAAIKLLRENKATQQIPVFIFSAHLDLDKIAAQIGADGYINKPFEMKQLEAEIEKFFVSRR